MCIRDRLFSTLNDVRAEATQAPASVLQPFETQAVPVGGAPTSSAVDQAGGTVPMTVIDREAEIRESVRQLLTSELGLDERSYRLVMQDASTAEQVLQQLRAQGRRLTDAVANHVEETAAKHLESVAVELNDLAGDNTNASQEARKFVIAHSGRSLAPRWKATGKQTLERLSLIHI